MQLIFSAALLAVFASTATAQDMRAQETVRLENFDATAGAAILDALAGGSLGDVDMLQEALAGTPLPALETTLAGDWRCRTMKLGGGLPLVVYAQFDCRITMDGTAFQFEKLTGSQLTRGTISLRDDRMIYLGVGYVADAAETAPSYADLSTEETGDGTIHPEIGIAEQSGPDKARIMLPSPMVESAFDILYLTR